MSGRKEKACTVARDRHSVRPGQVGVCLLDQVDPPGGRDSVVWEAIGFDGEIDQEFRVGISGTKASSRWTDDLERDVAELASREVVGPVPPHVQLNALVEIAKHEGFVDVSANIRA